jgi:hypothetical protein
MSAIVIDLKVRWKALSGRGTNPICSDPASAELWAVQQ